jgi:SpoIID/LytB domain protein
MYKKALFLSLALLLSSPVANADNQFTFVGSGLGHGVGLSQIGAKAMALDGKSAEEILKYYYTGVQIQPVYDWYDIKVNIGHQLTSANLQLASATGYLTINGYQISDQATIATFKYNSNGITTFIRKNKLLIATLPASNSLEINWSGTRFLPGDEAVVAFNSGKSVKYKFGQIKLLIVGKSFEASNTVRLKDEYLYGISEVSSNWPIEALRAQVIAARTYALSKAGYYRPSCDCELYGTIKDQLFIGIGKLAEPRYGDNWKAAVDQTNIDSETGLTITYEGLPINAYYSSSSNGMTESALNAFGTDQPYLQPVADPASMDPKLNPRYTNWSRSISAVIVAKAFNLSDIAKLEIIGKRIYATSIGGKQVSLRLETFRSRVVLPSPFFVISN